MLWLWVAFFVLILVLLALDLGVFNRESHVIGIREATGWTILWITVSLVFNVGVYFLYEAGIATTSDGPRDGTTAAIEFLTGYLIEKSLSVDNIFVIALVFRYFRVPAEYQHRVLFWGILGALVTRGTMIGVGVWLVEQFAWMFYVFGAFLIYSGVRMLVGQDDDLDPEKSRIVQTIKRVFRVTKDLDGSRFITRTADGALAFTPLMLVLVVVETADVVFAVDSIPAIFAITTDPFIVLTSNVFAILGLRSLYFVLAGVIDRFRYLTFTLTLILVFVGVKMLIHDVYVIDAIASLVFITSTLAVGIASSIVAERRQA